MLGNRQQGRGWLKSHTARMPAILASEVENMPKAEENVLQTSDEPFSPGSPTALHVCHGLWATPYIWGPA